MSRRATHPRYFKSRKGYYCQFNGKQVKLASGPDDAPNGETYLAALDTFKHLMEQGSLEQSGDANSVRAICNAYLAAQEKRKEEGRNTQRTFTIKLQILTEFVNHYGDMRVSDLKPYHAEKICLNKKTWGNNQKRLFLTYLKNTFNWAVKNELVNRNPFLAVELPKQITKSRERVITDAEHQQVLTYLCRPKHRSLKRLILALHNTGARPSELRNATVKDFNNEHGAIVYHADDIRREGEFSHKTSSKGKKRVIYFTGEVLQMIKEWVKEKRPTDLLFPTNRGAKHSDVNLDRSFKRVRERLNLPHFVPYAYRHTFATRWLTQGKSIELLATLLGNTPMIIRKHYSHLIHEHDTLREQLEAFRQQEQRKKEVREQERVKALPSRAKEVIPMRQVAK